MLASARLAVLSPRHSSATVKTAVSARPALVTSAQSLDDHCHSLSSTDTHRFESECLIGVLEPMDERCHDSGSGHAERMAERDRSTVHVELVHRDVEVAR